MQPLDALIIETWNQLKPQLLNSPEELARRLKRRDSRTFSRPPRAWCLAIRACDRRIGVINGDIDPEYATDPTDPDHPGRVVEHTVTLNADLLRQLCCPVTLDPAGELHDVAARKLGVGKDAINNARISGALHTRHIKGLLGRRGPPVPIVSSSKRLDPLAGRFPHPPPALDRHRIRLGPRPQRPLANDHARLVLKGHSAKKIAAMMRIQVPSVESRISLLCKKENVPNRVELARKLGLDPSLQPDRYGNARARRQRVLDLLLKGFSTPEIAAQLGRNCKAIHEDVHVLCKEHRIKGRKALISKRNEMNADRPVGITPQPC